MTGFIAMQRDALDHPLFRSNGDRFYAWFWLVAKAAWKPTLFDISGKIITLHRGQLCVSIRQLATEWKWSKSAVERFLTRLETETMIEREAGHGRLVLTIRNYAKYQDVTEAERDSSGTPPETPAGQQRDIKEPLNHLTIEKEDSASGDAPAHANDDLNGDGLTASDVLESWNELAEMKGLPKVRTLNIHRRRQLAARLREFPDPEDWRRALRHIHDTPWLCGDNDRGWRADFDFLLQPKSFTKLTEESYGKAN